MAVARVYRMKAAQGQGDGLGAALQRLIDALQGLPGMQGVEMLRDIDKPEEYLFIEKWDSAEAHKESGALVPKEAFAPVLDALAEKAGSGYFDYIRVTAGQ